MTNVEKIKASIEKDFEYCLKNNCLDTFKFYYNYSYGKVMCVGYFEDITEISKWWNETMNKKFLTEIIKRS